MQDISRSDISIPNAGEVDFHHTAKNMNSSINSKNDLNLTKQLNAEDNMHFDGSSTIDLFPTHTTTWQQHPLNTNRDLGQYRLSIRPHDRIDHNNTKLLLQGSDDPLISHGANNMLSHDDEHPGDFAKCLMAAYSNQHNYNGLHNQERISIKNTANFPEQQQTQHRPIKSGCSNLTKQQLKVKANLMSARNHKQNRITPPPTTAPNQKQHNNFRTKKKSDNSVKLKFHHQALPPEYLSHFEATQEQVRTVKGQTNTTQQRSSSKITNNPHKQSQPRNSHENVRSWLQKIAEIQRTANAAKEEINQQQKTNETQKISNNLHLDANNNHHQPHMQNLPYMGKITLDNCKSRRGRKPKKADICHMIYKNYGTVIPTKSAQTQDYPLHTNATISIKTDEIKTDVDEQPLNLCLRDQITDSYSISSGEEVTEMDSNCPTPLTTTSDCVRDAMLANNLKNSLDNLNELQQNDKLNGQIIKNSTPSNEIAPTTTTTTTTENVLHPVTMYYKKLLQSGVLLSNINGPFETIEKDNQLALKIPLPSGFFSTNKMVKPLTSPAAPNLEYTEPLTTPFRINSDSSTNQQDFAPKNR